MPPAPIPAATDRRRTTRSTLDDLRELGAGLGSVRDPGHQATIPATSGRVVELAIVRRRVTSDERGRLMQRVAVAGAPIALLGALEICVR